MKPLILPSGFALSPLWTANEMVNKDVFKAVSKAKGVSINHKAFWHKAMIKDPGIWIDNLPD